jgi:hypothetical protein
MHPQKLCKIDLRILLAMNLKVLGKKRQLSQFGKQNAACR